MALVMTSTATMVATRSRTVCMAGPPKPKGPPPKKGAAPAKKEEGGNFLEFLIGAMEKNVFTENEQVVDKSFWYPGEGGAPAAVKVKLKIGSPVISSVSSWT